MPLHYPSPRAHSIACFGPGLLKYSTFFVPFSDQQPSAPKQNHPSALVSRHFLNCTPSDIDKLRSALYKAWLNVLSSAQAFIRGQLSQAGKAEARRLQETVAEYLAPMLDIITAMPAIQVGSNLCPITPLTYRQDLLAASRACLTIDHQAQRVVPDLAAQGATRALTVL